jgi:hypothetical protein
MAPLTLSGLYHETMRLILEVATFVVPLLVIYALVTYPKAAREARKALRTGVRKRSQIR